MQKKFVVLACLLLILGVAGGAALFAGSSANAGLAMTELEVKKMTCGSCVATITEALQQQPGVETVAVSVTTGRSQITFNPAEINAKTIAAVVSESGFPASVLQQLTAAEFQALQAENEQMAAIYVAKIGNRLLARDEFDAIIDQRLAAAGSQADPGLRPQAIAQLWPQLKQRILLLEAAADNNVVVQDGEVDLRVKQLREQKPDLDRYIQARFGSADNFNRQLKEDMIIDRNIEDYVLVNITDSKQRQAQLDQWFQTLLSTTEVVIYDPQLKQATSASGSGCGSGGGGCCSKS